MTLFLSAVLIVLVLTETTLGWHSGWIQATYQECDPCRCNNPCLANVAAPHCRAVVSAGVVSLECFSDAQLNPSVVSHDPICARGAGNPLAVTATGATLTCNSNTDCPTDYVCYHHSSWWSVIPNVCCKDLTTCVKTGNCPALSHTPHCHWYYSRTCTTDSDCYGLMKCCGPYTGLAGCLANTKYCQNNHFTYAGK